MNRHLHHIVSDAARGMRRVVPKTATGIGREPSNATTMVVGALAGAAALAPMLIGAALAANAHNDVDASCSKQRRLAAVHVAVVDIGMAAQPAVASSCT